MGKTAKTNPRFEEGSAKRKHSLQRPITMVEVRVASWERQMAVETGASEMHSPDPGPGVKKQIANPFEITSAMQFSALLALQILEPKESTLSCGEALRRDETYTAKGTRHSKGTRQQTALPL